MVKWYDFAQGCIWDLKAIKSVDYCCKFSKQLQLNSKLIDSKTKVNLKGKLVVNLKNHLINLVLKKPKK